MKIKILFFLIVVHFVSVRPSMAQQVNSQQFRDLKMKFSIDKNFKITSFVGKDWDSGSGNNVCPCSGIICILQIPSGGGMETIHFVAYPSSKKGSLAESRKNVWQYHFVETEKTDTVKGNITWLRQKSKFKSSGENRFKDYVVHQFKGNKNDVYYTLYFWSKNFILNERPEFLEQIILSFDYFD